MNETRNQLPAVFRKSYKKKQFNRKLLDRIFIPGDRTFIENLFVENNNFYQIPENQNLSSDDIKKLKELEKAIKKQKSRIRIFRLGIVAAIIIALFFSFNAVKNPLVKKGIRNSLQTVFQAKAEIDYVNLKLLDSTLTVRGITVANKEKPMENLFEIETFTMDYDLVQLLKKKFVMNLGELTGITYGTPRKTSGALNRSEKSGETSDWLKIFQMNQEQFISMLKSQTKESIISLLEKYDPETFMQEALNNLKTPAMKDEIIQNMESISGKWEGTIQSLQDEIKSFSKDVEEIISIDTSGMSALEILSLVEKTQKTIAKAQEMKNRATEIRNQFDKDTQTVKSLSQQFQSSLKSDTSYVQKRISSLKVPDISDSSRLISSFFDNTIISTVCRWYPIVRDGIEKAREFSTAGAKVKDTVKPFLNKKKTLVLRSPGQNIQYSRELPSLLLREIKAGGHSPDKQFIIEGTICNINNDAQLLGKPSTASLSMQRGDYSESATLTADFRDKPDGDTIGLTFNGGNYPIKLEVSDNEEIKGLPVITGPGTVKTMLFYTKDDVMGLKGTIDIPKASITTEKFEPEYIYDIYSRILSQISRTDINVECSYSDKENMKFSLTSSADKEIAIAFKKVMDQELNSMKNKLQKEVDSRLDSVLGEFSDKVDLYNIMKSDTLANVTDIDNLLKLLENKQKNMQNKGSSSESSSSNIFDTLNKLQGFQKKQ